MLDKKDPHCYVGDFRKDGRSNSLKAITVSNHSLTSEEVAPYESPRKQELTNDVLREGPSKFQSSKMKQDLKFTKTSSIVLNDLAIELPSKIFKKKKSSLNTIIVVMSPMRKKISKTMSNHDM